MHTMLDENDDEYNDDVDDDDEKKKLEELGGIDAECQQMTFNDEIVGYAFRELSARPSTRLQPRRNSLS